jgi:hypothetical protein
MTSIDFTTKMKERKNKKREKEEDKTYNLIAVESGFFWLLLILCKPILCKWTSNSLWDFQFHLFYQYKEPSCGERNKSHLNEIQEIIPAAELLP